MPQPTGPRIRDRQGQVIYDFPLTARVEGLPKEREVPSLRIDGRDGEIVNTEMIQEKPRTISVVGKMYGRGRTTAAQKADLEKRIDDLMAAIARRDEVRLSRSADDTRYLPVYYTSATPSYIEGLARTAAVVRIQFKCVAPFWHSLLFEYLNQDVVFTPPVPVKSIVNKGNVPAAPLIWFRGRAGGGKVTTNPKIVNTATGLELTYAGELQNGECVIVDCSNYTATLLESAVASQVPWLSLSGSSTDTEPSLGSMSGTNVVGSMNDSFVVDGFPLAPGTNEVEIHEADGLLGLGYMFRNRWY